MVGLVAVDGVFGQCALAPCVGTSHTVNVEVDVEVDKISSLQFVGMLHVKILLTIVPRTDAERLTSVDAQLTTI